MSSKSAQIVILALLLVLLGLVIAHPVFVGDYDVLASTLQVIAGFVGAIAAVVALYYARGAQESAQRTVGLELEAQKERGRQRKLDLLDRLMLAAFKLQEAASQANFHHVTPSMVSDARGHYNVAYLAASEELPLPVCERLSQEIQLDKIITLASSAIEEIRIARKGL